MSPSHLAFVVSEPNGAGPDSRATWREIGIVFPHKKGSGFDLILHPQISVSGRIVITERKERPAREESR